MHLGVAFRAAFMPWANGVWIGDLGFQPGNLLGPLQTGDARSIGLLFSTLRVRPAGGVTHHSTDRAQAAWFGQSGQERIGFSFSHRDCSGRTKCKEWKALRGFECCHRNSHNILPDWRTELDGVPGKHRPSDMAQRPTALPNIAKKTL
jgi:hypothetical protein